MQAWGQALKALSTYVYIYTYIHTYTHTYIDTYLHTHTHTNTHTHTYIRTYTHAYMYISSSSSAFTQMNGAGHTGREIEMSTYVFGRDEQNFS